MTSVKVWWKFNHNNEYRWAVYVDYQLHGFGVETQRQTWRQMEEDKREFLERALAGNTEPTEHDPTKIPETPPKRAVEKLDK